MTQCPNCKFENNTDAIECQKCGIIFKKYKQHRVDQTQSLLTSCNACGNNISKNASSCPHCGEPIAGINRERKNEQNQENKKKEQGIGLLILFFIIATLFFFDFHKHYLPFIFDKKPEMSIYELTKLPDNERKVYMLNFERKLCKWVIREQKRNPGLIIDARAADCSEILGINK